MTHPYYQDDYATIYHGDCREILPELPQIDLCLTDPPYGIGRGKGFPGARKFGGRSGGRNANNNAPISRRQYKDTWDSMRPDKETFDKILNSCKYALIFGGNFFADILPQGTHWIEEKYCEVAAKRLSQEVLKLK